jgi:hypothetical protein
MSREYQRRYQLEKYRRWMAEARERLGGQCAVCGTTENLEFDHIDPAAKSFTLGTYRPNREAWDAEVAKCQLLCFEHHKEKTATERRTVLHGTWGMYQNQGCRCQICRDFVNAYMKEYKRRKRAETKAQRADGVVHSLTRGGLEVGSSSGS